MTVSSDRLAGALQTAGMALHEVASRTNPGQVALEVQRLNDAVRRAAAGRVGPFAQPADFAAMLLAHADPCNDAQAR